MTARLALALFFAASTSHAAAANFEVQLSRDWMEKHKDRTTTTARMVIHHSHQKPNVVGTGVR